MRRDLVSPKHVLHRKLWQQQGRIAPGSVCYLLWAWTYLKAGTHPDLPLPAPPASRRCGTCSPWLPLPAETAGTDRPAPYAFQPLTALTADQTSLDIEEYRQYQKLRLLQSVAGLDRGFAANSTAAALVESAALELTGTGEAVTLSWTPGELLLHQEPNPPR